jgi:predicted DNA-binding antitoxin AbrB/MazE fold protein
MSPVIDAVYQGGVFRPTVPPDLPEGTAVRLSVEPASPNHPARDGRAAYTKSSGRSSPVRPNPDRQKTPAKTWTRCCTGGPETPVTFVDTSAWFALLVPGDQNHVRATAWLAAYAGPLITTDSVIDETLTLLRSRGQRDEALDWGSVVFGPNRPASVHDLTLTDIAPLGMCSNAMPTRTGASPTAQVRSSWNRSGSPRRSASIGTSASSVQ